VETTELSKGGLRKRLVAINDEVDPSAINVELQEQNSSGEENHTLLAK
jgi:hypothetical protein